jgi:hypothetical protein
MNQTFVCGQCGHANPISRVYCLKCGAKLGVNNVSYSKFAKGPGILAVLGRLLRAAVLVVILLGLGLVLWPLSARTIDTQAVDVTRLHDGLQRMLEVVRAGQPAKAVVSETEANAYLASILKQNEEATQSQGFQLGVRDIQVTLATRRVVVLVVATLGPVTLSYELEGRPVVQDNAFRLDVQRAQLGHLTLPAMAMPWAVDQVARIFSGFRMERELLGRMERIEVEPGKVTLVKGGR